MRQVRPGQQIMVWRGSASRAQAIAWGADEFIAQPFSGYTLLRTVRAILGIPAPATPEAEETTVEPLEVTPGG